MLDYEKLKQATVERRAKLMERERQIDREITDLTAEAEEIRRELAGIDQILNGLEVMQSEGLPEPPGMTEHIKRVLQLTTVPLSPVTLRDSLKAVGITGSSDKNLLISVHTVLGRLKPFLAEEQQDGRTVYKWKEPLTVGQRVTAMAQTKHPTIRSYMDVHSTTKKGK
jgi:hypothetical protein